VNVLIFLLLSNNKNYVAGKKP